MYSTLYRSENIKFMSYSNKSLESQRAFSQKLSLLRCFRIIGQSVFKIQREISPITVNHQLPSPALALPTVTHHSSSVIAQGERANFYFHPFYFYQKKALHFTFTK